jgi:hypothetical protein
MTPDPLIDDGSGRRVCSTCGDDYAPFRGHFCVTRVQGRRHRWFLKWQLGHITTLVVLFVVLTAAAVLLVAFVRECEGMFGGTQK